MGQKLINRKDIVLKNPRGLKIYCSHFEPVLRPCEKLPCIIYLHGNCSSRMEALSILQIILPLNITCFAFDFSGCGKSEGEYISLGYYERDDLQVVIENLRNSKKVSTIGLWGRSMGAVTALMHADRDPSIAAMILDSPFTSLKRVAKDLMK
jgi:pimeloyl-ACP methyl ester carboxylesterase